MTFSSEIISTISKGYFSILVLVPNFWHGRVSAGQKRRFRKNCDFDRRYILMPEVLHGGENHFPITVTHIIQKSKNICGEPLAY